jgi:hypothetical protein
MGDTQRQIAVSTQVATWTRLSAASVLLAIASLALLAAASARANVGYELNATTPSHSLGGQVPHGIAVDQSNQRIYVAVVTTDPGTATAGQIDRFESDLTSAGIIAPGGGYYTGVAVNPVTQGFYAAQAVIHTSFGNVGMARMDLFSSSGTPGAQFAVSDTQTLPQVATDSSGDVYYPNATTGKVQVFNSAGALQEEIGCNGCPGSSTFGRPVSVAINSEDDLFVVDLASDRVVKLTSSGGPYTFASVLQSGRGAAAVGVDPSEDNVFVGDLPSGVNYHIVAYDSSGTQFDDFGAGLFTDPTQLGALSAPQSAVDATTHRLYVGDRGKFYIFDQGTISPPAAAAAAASPVGQLTATLRASVNANGHAVLNCKFEYTDDSNFQAHEFSGAKTAPCSGAPDGSSDTPVSAKVSGLLPLTVYHYRVTATSNAGSATSNGETFETMPVIAPTVTTEPALAITDTTVTLAGTVNPHGGSASDCHFKYGTSTSYGSNTPCLALPEAVATDVGETRKILNLTPRTTYHYRLMVTTNAGTAEGKDVEFTTASLPPPETGEPPPAISLPPVAPVPPPVIVSPTAPRPLKCRKGFVKRRVRGKLRCVKKKRHPKRRLHRESRGS